MSEDMRNLFYIQKGQYKKDNKEICISGYDPSDEDTKEWYMLMDCKTFHCIACGTDYNKVLQGVHTYIKRFKGNAKLYFKHVSKVTSDDYYEVTYLGKKPLTEDQRNKKVIGKCPRISPPMRRLYEAVYEAFGDTYKEDIKDMEDLAYNDLKGDKPFRKSQKLMKKKGVNKTLVETPITPVEPVVEDKPTLKKLVKPKLKRGVKMIV